ncbi:MAG: IS6 family transposase [Dehalococcoidia bacterium]
MTEDKRKPITAEDVAKLFAKPVVHLEEHHFTQPEPIKCKWCGSVDIKKYGIRDGVQEYFCLKCGRKFNAKDVPYKKQTPVEQIGTALDMFYDGLSLRNIARHLEHTYNNPVNESTIYRWVMSYTEKAVNILEKLKPRVSDILVVDEIVIKVGGDNWWFWDVIDEDTRFLLASHLSLSRTTRDASSLIEKAWKRASKAPKVIISDRLYAYLDGIETVFGADTEHIQSKEMTADIYNNLIQPFRGILKDRINVTKRFKTLDTALTILDGFLIHYNFFRPLMTLRNQTPAEEAGIKSPYRTWVEFIRQEG